MRTRTCWSSTNRRVWSCIRARVIPGGTLVNALLPPAIAGEYPRGGIVHRLDKDTSGLLVVAATLGAHSDLVAQLQEKSVRRDYAAIVRGRPSGGGTVDAPSGATPGSARAWRWWGRGASPR
jgi:23S rRNA-/tRNA-specific pseudouridylate synthase